MNTQSRQKIPASRMTSLSCTRKIVVVLVLIVVILVFIYNKRFLSQVFVKRECEIVFSNTSIAHLQPQVIQLAQNPKKEKTDVPMPLYRDLFQQDSWPDVEMDVGTTLGKLPRTVHYVWCGDKQFLFRHYLALLSAVRVLKATTINFLHNHLPQKDGSLYNMWFEELVYSLPNVKLIRFDEPAKCESTRLLGLVMSHISREGGVYIGENAIIPSLPNGIENIPFWFAFSGGNKTDPRRGVAIAQRGLDKTSQQAYIRDMLEAKASCVKAEQYTASDNDIHCVIVDSDVHPRDVWQAQTPFAELARWLYYGRRSPIVAVPDPSRPIPRIAHYVWLKTNPSAGDLNLPFSKFLSMISAIYVGGFQHVYVHGNVEPEGEWWRQLRSENVTFVRIERPSPMFQMDFPILQANSDFLRALLLLNYGGAYMDVDVVWTSWVPDWLLNYPAVASFDWPKNYPWPDNFNLGVLLARPNAPWLRQWLTTFRFYRSSNSGFTAIVMPYKVYEHYPDELYVYSRLQVICYCDICHPTWHDDYRRPLNDRHPTRPFNITDVHAVHVTQPKPAASFRSPKHLKEGKDVLANIGRHILKLSGRTHLLP